MATSHVYYKTFADQRSVNRGGSGTVEMRLGRRINLFAHASSQNTRDRLNFEIDARARRLASGIQTGMKVGLSRKLTAELSGSESQLRYAEDATFLGVNLSETMSRDSRGISAKIAYVMTPLTTVEVAGQNSRTGFRCLRSEIPTSRRSPCLARSSPGHWSLVPQPSAISNRTF